ncbi:hypothetical protein CBM2598_P310024 [Cupriavidus taiwanensis]|nr:hypothetical protein CBM2597_P340020 [Cupriavidus taiwanensis]SOZ95924.1 hypothetical protein CBM2598_P310024 [Cupriavidus taiwanensis]
MHRAFSSAHGPAHLEGQQLSASTAAPIADREFRRAGATVLPLGRSKSDCSSGIRAARRRHLMEIVI